MSAAMTGLFSTIGLAMCGAVMVAFVAAAWDALSTRRRNRTQFDQWQQAERARLDRQKLVQRESATATAAVAMTSGAWNGWRPFRVSRLVRETTEATSFYLQPVDGKPIADYKPGQYLTIRVPLPGQPKPAIRCYSLSDAPNGNEYRITVKVKPAPEEVQTKSVSRYLIDQVMEGDVFEFKQPGGDFFLDMSTPAPIVLLAAGVGITPLFAMIRALTATADQRQIVLCYGNTDSKAHLFRREIEDLQMRLPNLHVLNFYSQPLREDVEAQRFGVHGHVTTEVLKSILPDRKFQFFLCGPPPFMDSLYHGLLEWGVPQGRIHFEAFGPATVRSITENQPARESPRTPGGDSGPHVTFVPENGEAIEGAGVLGTILEIAEELNVELQTGCRAGNCGTCAIRLLKGQVKYPDGMQPAVHPGYCLACIATPQGDIEVEA
jgi:ferredoxin-NADP reductase